jgi:hypothetical protein
MISSLLTTFKNNIYVDASNRNSNCKDTIGGDSPKPAPQVNIKYLNLRARLMFIKYIVWRKTPSLNIFH